MIFVTGASGLVGSHLLYDLLRSGKQVRALVHRPESKHNVLKVFSLYSADATTLFNRIEWVQADLSDIYSLLDILEGVDDVYHCAATVSFHKKDKALLMQTNAEGTANLVNACLEKKIRKFCHVSSVATLGRPDNGQPMSEADFWKASPSNSQYSISKYAAEREVWRAMEEGLPAVIVNPSMILGPGNWNQSTCAFFKKGYEGIRFYTEGSNGFVDVRDVSALMIRLMESEIVQERFVLNAENKGFREFFDAIHRHFGKPSASIKAGAFLSKVAWVLDSLRSKLSGTAALITKESAQSAQRTSLYSSQKIRSTFPDFQFIPVERSVEETCAHFLTEIKGN